MFKAKENMHDTTFQADKDWWLKQPSFKYKEITYIHKQIVLSKSTSTKPASGAPFLHALFWYEMGY